MKILKTGKTIGKTLKNAGRLKTIVAVFARHGFHNVAERIQLGKFLLERLSADAEVETLSVAERVRKSFEELGPTFVKLGQLLATRPDLVPEDWVTEFEKLHANVKPLEFSVIESVLIEEFGDQLYTIFQRFEEKPLGSASIAQVHRAWLKDGKEVVIKVQRPGIVSLINDDLNVLYFLAELLNHYIEETRPFNPVGIVDEFFKTLELETNFLVEANNIRRISLNFANDEVVKIPEVYLELSTERVLVLEALQGIPLSSDNALKQEGVDPEVIIRAGLSAYLRMVFKDGFFHGDLHAGNFFILPNGQIGLIDFGVVGRLNRRTQTAIASMLVALAQEDYERLANEYVDLAPFDERTDVDLFARQLRDTVAPYYGLTMKNINLGRVLMNSAGVASKNHVSLPTEMMMFFKSIVTIEGLGRRIIKDFDFLKYSLQFATDLAKNQYSPEKMTLEAAELFRDSKALIYTLPRQVKQLLRKLNDPDFAVKIELRQLHDLRRAHIRAGFLNYWGLIIGALILSGTLAAIQPNAIAVIWGLPVLSLAGYGLAVLFGTWAFFRK